MTCPQGAQDELRLQLRDGGIYQGAGDEKHFRWKVKPDMEVNSQPSVREVRFGTGTHSVWRQAEC
ncbi:Minor tail protein M [Escherichia coli]|nr:Minor tail protein M [Escherichia coli]